MKKVGTQVELDLTKILKMLDKAFVALEKQSKVWDDWLNVVKKALPTLAGVESTLGKVIGRLNQLKFTSEGATEAGKEEMAVRRRQIAVLQAVRDEYRQQAKAAEKASRTVEQAAKREVAAADAAARAQDRHTKAAGRGLKKMVLWGIGAASAYRLFMKLRRAIEETTQEVYGHTEEMKGLTTAWDDFTHAVVVSMAPYGEVLKSMDRMAGVLNDVSDGLLGTSAELDGYTAAADTAAESSGYFSNALQGILLGFGAFGPVAQQYVGWLTVSAARMGILSDETAELILSSYDSTKTLRENENALAMAGAAMDEAAKKTKGFGKAVDDLRKRLEKYHKAMYRITERGLADRLQAQRDYYDSVTELELDRQREAEDDAIAAARRLEDIHRDFARRLAALEMKLRHRIRKLRSNFDKRRRRAAEILADKLLSIERKYQDKLLDIERTYARSMYEAIATRDATAALQAMRRRKEDIIDAKRDRSRARADAYRDYWRRIRDLEESLREQERLARRSYEDQLEELHRWLAEQEEDHRTSLRRREEDAVLSYARSLADLKQSFLDRMAAIQRQIVLDRRNAKIDYLLRESAYAAHLARMAAIWQSYQGTMTMPSSSTPTAIPRFAKGGMMIVNRPTLAMFGEGGRPEIVIAQPLSATSHAHNITGGVTHQINATIQQSIAGMEGRIAGAVHQALADVIH